MLEIRYLEFKMKLKNKILARQSHIRSLRPSDKSQDNPIT